MHSARRRMGARKVDPSAMSRSKEKRRTKPFLFLLQMSVMTLKSDMRVRTRGWWLEFWNAQGKTTRNSAPISCSAAAWWCPREAMPSVLDDEQFQILLDQLKLPEPLGPRQEGLCLRMDSPKVFLWLLESRKVVLEERSFDMLKSDSMDEAKGPLSRRRTVSR